MPFNNLERSLVRPYSLIKQRRKSSFSFVWELSIKSCRYFAQTNHDHLSIIREVWYEYFYVKLIYGGFLNEEYGCMFLTILRNPENYVSNAIVRSFNQIRSLLCFND